MQPINTKIQNLNVVEAYTRHRVNVERININENDVFNDFKVGEKIFTIPEAEIKNTLMNRCFNNCEELNVNICDLLHDILPAETNLDKIFAHP